jgi:hypothetical protein
MNAIAILKPSKTETARPGGASNGRLGQGMDHTALRLMALRRRP